MVCTCPLLLDALRHIACYGHCVERDAAGLFDQREGHFHIELATALVLLRGSRSADLDPDCVETRLSPLYSVQ
jgi:hypothetical protein